MSVTPTSPLNQLQPPSLSPLKISSSSSSLASNNSAPANQAQPASQMATTTINNRPASQASSQPGRDPSKKPKSNLFIPRKPQRRPGAANQEVNTPKANGNAVLGQAQPSSAGSIPQPRSQASTPRMISEPSTSSQPKGISQAPPPIDAPYVEFDLLTGDIHGAPAANGFSPQVDWNIFRFHRIPGDKAVVDAFAFPIKLNRKNFKYREAMEVDEEEPLGPNDGDPSTSGATEASGLLQGLDLQELKNVVVPASASQIGQSVKMETPGAGSSGAKKNEKLVPLKGPDGQVVIGSNGQPVMVTPAIAAQAKGGRLPYIPGVTAEPKGKKGKVAQRGPGGAPGAAGKPGEGKPGEGRKRGGKKTRQVFLIPEHTRKLRKEERFPWLWEDSSGKEVWEGRRVERNKVKMQLLQVCRDGTFRWYPARKHYMFTKLPTWTVLGAEEANEQFEKEQKRKNPLYFAQNTPYTSISRAFAHQARLEDMDQKKASTFGGEATVTRSQNLFRLVDRGRPVSSFEKDEDDFEAGDEETKKFKQEREQELFGMEGDMDEMEFEEEIADDDERVHADGNEEEEKEQEERLKREWRQANKTNAEVDDYAITGRPIRLDKAGKRMKKILRGQDKSGTLYESDSDKDPYASQEESDSESDLEEKERIEKEKAEKEKAEKAKKEEEEQLKQLLEEKEKEREAEKEKEKEKEKKGKGPAKPETPVPNKAVAALSGKSMPTSGKNSAVQSRGGSPKPNAGGNMSRQVSPGLSTAAPARASSPSGSKPMGITSHSRSPSASGTSTPVVGAQGLKRKAPTQGGETPFKRQRTASPPDNPSQKAPSTSTASTPAPQAQKSKSKPEKPHADFPGCLTREMVVNYLQEREAQGLKTRTKDAIERFKPMWAGAKGGAKEGADERNKDLLIYWIQKVANLEGEKGLVLRRSGH